MGELNLAIAFAAGIVSFLSPCVLPLVPGWLTFLAGTTLAEAARQRRQVAVTSLFFVLGFSLVFALLGVLLNTALEAVAYDAQIWLARIGGALIIVFGLILTGLWKPLFLQREFRFHPRWHFSSRSLTALVFGAAFAAGWTPCVGAVLGGILGLAASQPGSAFGLLLAYSLGLALPFFIAGLFAEAVTRLIRKYGRAARIVNVVFGIIMIVLGALVFTRTLSRIANLDLIQGVLQNVTTI